jgi:hypothetical protein
MFVRSVGNKSENAWVPISIYENDGWMNRYGVITDQRCDGYYLSVDIVHEVGAILSVNKEAIVASGYPSNIPVYDSPSPILRIDDPDPRRCHHDVINVSPTIGYLTVIENYFAILEFAV